MDLSERIVKYIFSKSNIEFDKDITIHDDTFYSDVILKGSLGLGESYMDGKWDSQNIDILVSKILKQGIYQKVAKYYDIFRRMKSNFINLQNNFGSKKVIHEHYDLPIKLYETFLDPYFQYTCAFFNKNDDLNQAQINKMHLICEKLDLKQGESVLDIGGGWGGLALFMKKEYNANPIVLTLSKQQATYARSLGLDVLEIDYRDIPPNLKFDKISAIGIFEHIGHKNYKHFFQIVSNKLKNNGKFLLHTLYTPYSETATNPWLNKYIFPNSELPTRKHIDRANNLFNPLETNYPAFHELTPHYYPTLIAWNTNLKTALKENQIQLSEKNKKMWEFYFLSCAGAIKANHMRVAQFTYQK